MNAIEFENISKQYRLGYVTSKTLGDDLNRWWTMNILHKPDPLLKIGSVNDRAGKADSDYVWALKNINFNVEQGDVVGIIGKNGAGKSTLLKLLSRVTNPTTGIIRARGKIASLLEVGTGFHPELTGRENIYMNGAIMGMSKQEITRKLDEIVEFSGCERYIDTPVKRYSSGMSVRLGFAVAAHLEPEILVVDEVLAVGDAEFQKKAIGKMQDVANGEGRTVLFVSHNMASVRNLCKNGIVLKDGSIEYVGTANQAVDYYIDSNVSSFNKSINIDGINVKHGIKDISSRKAEFKNITILNEDIENLSTDEPLNFEITLHRNLSTIEKCQCAIIIRDTSDIRFATFVSPIITFSKNSDDTVAHISLKNHHLAAGKYKLQFDLGLKDYVNGTINYDIIPDALMIQVSKFSKNAQLSYAAWDKTYGFILDCDSIELNK
ncbi:MAG: ABC transporter ATP-binding protein [Paludibacteraceae bacterium]|nr:ABC transporter ATP-binding protein [Paludibacteraceae bacterium]